MVDRNNRDVDIKLDTSRYPTRSTAVIKKKEEMNVKGTQTFKHSPSFTVEIKVSPEQKSTGFFPF